MLADRIPALTPALFKSATNVLRAQTSPRHQIMNEAELHSVFSRITIFLAHLDLNQFYATLPVDSPVYSFIETFKPEKFMAMVAQAFQVPKADASKEELQAIIDAKVKLDKRVAYLEWMFGLVKAAGLNDGGLVLSLAWLAKRNQELYSELMLKANLNDLEINHLTFTNQARGNSQPPFILPSHTMEKFPENNHGFSIPSIRVFPPDSVTPYPRFCDSFQDKIVQNQAVPVKKPSLQILNSPLGKYCQPRLPGPIDVQTTREMAAQHGRLGGKPPNKESSPSANPCLPPKYHHPLFASPDKYIPPKKIIYRAAPDHTKANEKASDVPLWRRSAPTAASRSHH